MCPTSKDPQRNCSVSSVKEEGTVAVNSTEIPQAVDKGKVWSKEIELFYCNHDFIEISSSMRRTCYVPIVDAINGAE